MSLRDTRPLRTAHGMTSPACAAWRRAHPDERDSQEPQAMMKTHRVADGVLTHTNPISSG